MSWSLYTEDPVYNMEIATMTTENSVTRNRKKLRPVPITLAPSED